MQPLNKTVSVNYSCVWCHNSNQRKPWRLALLILVVCLFVCFLCVGGRFQEIVLSPVQSTALYE